MLTMYEGDEGVEQIVFQQHRGGGFVPCEGAQQHHHLQDEVISTAATCAQK